MSALFCCYVKKENKMNLTEFTEKLLDCLTKKGIIISTKEVRRGGLTQRQ